MLDQRKEAELNFSIAIAKVKAERLAADDALIRKSNELADTEKLNAKEVKTVSAAAMRDQQGRMRAVGDSLGDLMTISEQFRDSNRSGFVAYKALAAAQAGVNAWLSYSQVMADQTIQPTWLKQGMASVSLAAGLMAVSQIAASSAPGRAMGGPVSAGSLYEVNERGPELLTMGDRNWLMMGNQSGKVTSNANLNARGGAAGMAPQVHVHNYSGEPTETQTSADGKRIDVIIGRVKTAVAADIGNGVGDIPKSIQQAYGLSRSGRR